MALVLQAQTLEPSCLALLLGLVTPAVQVIKPLSALVSSPKAVMFIKYSEWYMSKGYVNS